MLDHDEYERPPRPDMILSTLTFTAYTLNLAAEELPTQSTCRTAESILDMLTVPEGWKFSGWRPKE